MVALQFIGKWLFLAGIFLIAAGPLIAVAVLIRSLYTRSEGHLAWVSLCAIPGWWLWGLLAAGHVLGGGRAWIVWLPLSMGLAVTGACWWRGRQDKSLLSGLARLFLLGAVYHFMMTGVDMENGGRLFP